MAIAFLTLLVGLMMLLSIALTISTLATQERTHAASLIEQLLQRLAKDAPFAIITDMSDSRDETGMRRIAFRTPGFTYTHLSPKNWESSDPDAPRLLRMIEGAVTNVGDSSTRNLLLAHPLWARSDVASFTFLIGEDPHGDPHMRMQHGLFYELTAKDGVGATLKSINGVLAAPVLRGHAHNSLIQTITDTALMRLNRAVDSEGGMT